MHVGAAASRTGRCARSSASRAATAASTLREDYVLARRRAVRRRPRRARLARAAEAAEAALPDVASTPRAPRTRRRTATSSARRTATRSRASRGSTSSGARRAGSRCINDAKYGYDVRGGDIGISAVRSPGVGVARPARARARAATSSTWTRAGRAFACASCRTPATGATADVVRRAAELNQPPFALIETLPRRAAAAARVVRATTAAATSSSRSSSTRRTATAASCARTSRPAARRRARSTLLGRSDRGATSGANEIKTFLVPRDGRDGRETDLLER